MPEITITADTKQLLEQIQSLRARVRELEHALGASSDLAKADVLANAPGRSNKPPVSSPFFPFHIVFEETEKGVAALGDHHQIRHCNQRLTRMLKSGYSDLLDRPFVETVAPEHRARFMDLIAPGQQKTRVDVALLTGDNHHVPVHLAKHEPSAIGSHSISLFITVSERKPQNHHLDARLPFAELFQLSPVPIFLSSLADGRLLEVNDRFLYLTGYARAQVIGRSGADLRLWPSATERAAVVECLQQGDSVHHFVGRLRTQRGQWREVFLSASLLTRDGQQFMVGMIEDVTKHKQEHGVADLQAQLLANVQDAVIATDLKENITYWNPAAEQIYGWKAASVLGKNLNQIIRSNYSPKKRAEILRLVKETGRIFTSDMVHYHRDGTPIYVEGTVIAIRGQDGQIQGFAGSYRDVTERKRADQALVKSEEKFAKMFEATTTPLCLATREGLAMDVNSSLLQLVGYRREEILGHNVLELDIWPNLIVAARIGVMIAAGQRVRNVEVEWHTRRGETKNVLMSVEPIQMNGKTYLLGVATDITDRKQAEQEILKLNADLEERVAERTTELERANQALTQAMQRLQAHADNSPLALIEFDPEYRVTSWSRGAERMFGWTAQEVIGKTIPELPWVYDADAERVAILGREMLAGHQLRNIHTNRNYRKDGSIIECEWYNSALLDSEGKLISVRSQVLNITDRQQAREQIQALNRHLEQRAHELEIANKELESFSYSVSHDLRAPLAAVESFSRLLLADYGAQLPEASQRYLDLIRSNTEQMEELIQSLLALSRLTSHALKKEQVNMTALVQEALETLQKQVQRANLTIELGALPDAQADPVLLKQVWVNLIANACKFTREREHARIEIGCGRHDGEERVYFVRDNGVGFEMAQADRLFGVFQRLHREEDYEGMGVGLAIVRRIIQRHGGRVWAEGQVNAGATFYFTLE